VFPIANFSHLPANLDHDIAETHKNLARIKRKETEESKIEKENSISDGTE
jgi:hypothetical protein